MEQVFTFAYVGVVDYCANQNVTLEKYKPWIWPLNLNHE